MKTRLLLSLTLTAVAGLAQVPNLGFTTGAVLVPVQKFAAGPAFTQARLSPDGQFFAFIDESDGDPWLKIVDL